MESPRLEPVHAPPIMEQSNASNTLGLAGFIVALVGIVFSAGLLCPVGLILSLLALGRAPRGFAIAGTIIGLLGSCCSCLGALLLLPILMSGAAFAATIAFLLDGSPALVTLGRMVVVEQAITEHVKSRGLAPSSLSDLQVDPAELVDGWGTPLQFQSSRQGSQVCWTLQSAGSDRTLDGSDFSFSECLTVPGP
jgi:hypothetical protein